MKKHLMKMDPRTRIFLSFLAIIVIFISTNPFTILAETIVITAGIFLLGFVGEWLGSLRLFVPMAGIVFSIAWVSFDLSEAIIASLRLLNLLTFSFILFRIISPEELGDSLRKLGIPYEITFILRTSMRYVPLIAEKIRHIIEAQKSRGIDLRPRIKNIRNLPALIMPLIVQSFFLAEELALAMESRGFGKKGRSLRRRYRIAPWEYGLMMASVGGMVLFMLW